MLFARISPSARSSSREPKLLLSRFPLLGYIRKHPFSTMAICNIIGDTGYLGFAFAAEGFVSMPKLFGACFAMVAHLLLLAYGDDQARMVASEGGGLMRLFFKLRERAQRLTQILPAGLQRTVRTWPVGITFFMLSVNGVAFMFDGFLRFTRHPGLAMADQAVMGLFITIGTAAFAIADFVRGQRMANFLTKLAPSVLAGASVLNVILAVTTFNPFVIMSVIAFILSNFAGFFTHIDKEKGQHLHS